MIEISPNFSLSIVLGILNKFLTSFLCETCLFLIYGILIIPELNQFVSLAAYVT